MNNNQSITQNSEIFYSGHYIQKNEVGRFWPISLFYMFTKVAFILFIYIYIYIYIYIILKKSHFVKYYYNKKNLLQYLST